MAANAWMIIPENTEERRVNAIHREFYDGKRVGLTFGRTTGDLTNVQEPADFSQRYAKTLKKKPSAKNLVNFGRIFHNLYCDMAVGDLVVLPSQGQLYVGVITSGAYCIADEMMKTCHARDVKWIALYMRQRFSEQSLKSYPQQLAISLLEDGNRFLLDLKQQLRVDKRLPA